MSRTVSATLILLIVTNIIHSVFGKICDDAYQCTSDSIIDTALCYGFLGCSQATIDGSYAECGGYYGCYEAKQITASIYVDCKGAYGCYNANEITAVTYIHCQGYYSCAFVSSMESLTNTNCTGEGSCRSSIVTAGGHITCNAQNACAYGQLVGGKNIYCYSHYGCSNALITANDNVYVYGHHGASYSSISAQKVFGYGADALREADLDSIGVSVMDVYSWGYHAGFGAHFICRSGSVCNLDCIGNGCYGMELVCLWNTKCSVSPTRCTSGGKIDGIDCPIHTRSLSLEQDAKIMESIEAKKQQKMKDPESVEMKAQFITMDEERLKQKINGPLNISLIFLSGGISSLITFILVSCYMDKKYRKIYNAQNNQYKLLM